MAKIHFHCNRRSAIHQGNWGSPVDILLSFFHRRSFSRTTSNKFVCLVAYIVNYFETNSLHNHCSRQPVHWRRQPVHLRRHLVHLRSQTKTHTSFPHNLCSPRWCLDLVPWTLDHVLLSLQEERRLGASVGSVHALCGLHCRYHVSGVHSLQPQLDKLPQTASFQPQTVRFFFFFLLLAWLLASSITTFNLSSAGSAWRVRNHRLGTEDKWNNIVYIADRPPKCLWISLFWK